MDDLRTLEQMLAKGMFDGTRRIGAEQEFVIVDRSLNPAPLALAVLERLSDRRFTTELGRFNLEANLTPRLFRMACLRELRAELEELCRLARKACRSEGGELVMAGIWPTFDVVHARLKHMTPLARFTEFNRSSLKARGGRLSLTIHGVDTLALWHDNIMLEAGPTSFQVHLQVAAEEFVPAFNAALLLAAPLVAVGANSPILGGKRLWHETRIPLLERSADLRTPAQARRGGRSRTSLGHGFLETSVLDAFRADIGYFEPVVGVDTVESSSSLLARGKLPRLQALTAFNGTVWRWVRPCYGITEGRPHLRIENRVLAAGPTVEDEIANAAFWLGLMVSVPATYGDVRFGIRFEDADANLHAAARHGLDATLQWLGGRTMTARDLIETQLLDLALDGLVTSGVDLRDARAAIDVVAERVRSGRTGAAWAMNAHALLPPAMGARERAFCLAGAIKRQCWSGLPVHAWPIATAPVPFDEQPSLCVAMRSEFSALSPAVPLEVAECVLEVDATLELVVETAEGQFVGLLDLADVQRWRVAHQEVAGTALDAVRRDVLVLDELESVDAALQKLRAVGQRTAVVLRRGYVVGVVRLADLLELRARFDAVEVGAAHPTAGASP